MFAAGCRRVDPAYSVLSAIRSENPPCSAHTTLQQSAGASAQQNESKGITMTKESKKNDEFIQGVAWVGAIVGALMGLGAADANPDVNAAAGFIGGGLVGGIGGAIFAFVVSVVVRLLTIALGILITLYRLGIIPGLAS